MKTPLIILLTLITQSLCGQYDNITSWIASGVNEIEYRDPATGDLNGRYKQIMTSNVQYDISFTLVPTPEYDRQLTFIAYYGGRQNYNATNMTVVQWKYGLATTNTLSCPCNAHWATGGDCVVWTGTNDVSGWFYMMSHADIAVRWITNTDYIFGCYGNTDTTRVITLYRTNARPFSPMNGMGETALIPGETRIIPAPVQTSSGENFYLRYMTIAHCPHCGQGCPLNFPLIAYTPPRKTTPSVSQGGALHIEFPSIAQASRWELSRSSDAVSWTPVRSGFVSLADRVDGKPVVVEEPVAGTVFFRMSFREATAEESLEEMIEP